MRTNPLSCAPAHRRGGFLPIAAPLRLRIAFQLLAALLVLPLAAAAAYAQSPLLPSGVAYDAAGNLYFADTNRHQVFESTLAGALVVIAGNGTQGFSGDGGAATAASLDSPQSVAIGQDGTLYIADTGNQRIRSVANGLIATFAGTGTTGFGGDNGPLLAALFNHPSALAIDSAGALLVCDSNNHRIRRIAAGTITTIAGTGLQGFFGDGGPASQAQLDTPSGIADAADGRIFIADTHNQRIRVIGTNGLLTTFAGTGIAGYAGDGAVATSAQLALPRGLFATSSGALLIADSNNHRIRQVDAQGIISTIAGTGLQGSSADAAAGSNAALNTPRSVALSSFSAPVFADTGNSLVRELLTNANLYLPASLAIGRSTSVVLTTAPQAVYGQSVATVTVSGSAGTPQGGVQLLEATTVVGQSVLTAGVASITSPTLGTGSHTLTAHYLGDGVNPASSSAAVTISVSQAASITTEQPAASSYAGLPLVLTANVASATQGIPTGTVTFTEGPTTVAQASLSAGAASGIYLAPAAGSHAIVASYGGDANFTPSASAVTTATVGPMPDFMVSPVGSTTQTVLAGAIAVYTFSVASQPGPFTGAVSMSVGTLPLGVTAAFSPPQLVPGTGSAQVTLSLQTSTSLVLLEMPGRGEFAMLALLLPCLVVLRRRRGTALACASVALLLVTAQGCGDRTLSAASQANLRLPLTVSGTGTDLAGAVRIHSTPITLIVQK
jgi:sugar lactone lactonase YvrE